MGVHGLWKLIESSGKPIPIETLENKVLAVDISIWLHQSVKGFQDSSGASVANSHLLGIYHRVCKLLYFKIKPVFVFDGGVPALKRQTIAKRNQLKSRNASEADRLQKQLLSTLLKHSAISKVLSEKTKASLPLPKKNSEKDNLYALPSSTEFDSTFSSSDEEETEETSGTTNSDSSPTKQFDLHTIDTTSSHFKSLPLDVKHEILTDLKETRKQNTWAKLHLFPKQSDDFSTYQMKRLLKRQEVQSALEEVSKEMGGMSLSLAELESLLKDQGIKTTEDSNIGKRIASDETTRYLYIKNIQEEIEKAKEKERAKNGDKNEDKNLDKDDDEEELEKAIQLSLETPSSSDKIESKQKTKADLEEEEELQKAIQLSLQETPSTSTQTTTPNFSFLSSFNDEDFQSDSDEDYVTPKKDKPSKKLSSALSYMKEYSALSANEINKIINSNTSTLASKRPKNKGSTINLSNVFRRSKSSDCESELNKNNGAVLKKAHLDNISEETVTMRTITENNNNTTIPSEETSPENTIITEEKIEEIKTTVDIEIMSDSESSSDVDPDIQVSIPKLEIIIDPNKIENDDLFSDIFNDEPTNIKDQEHSKLKVQEDKDQGQSQLLEGMKDKILGEEQQTDKNKVQEAKSTEEAVSLEKNELKDDNTVEETSEISVALTTAVTSTNIEPNQEMPIRKDAAELAAPKMSIKEMEELKDNLQTEKIDLIKEKAHKERLANNITDQMYQEAQELLELFGVPYIIAPMEAEAQCAFLDEIELTNGTITDDSDIWLFGGRTVYKNFFNQSKYVMEFKSENIEHHFKLTREQMILLALLVGSDYTTGLQGVGPVTALEILASFPPSKSKEFILSQDQLITGLKEFKSWFVKGKAPGPGRSALKNKLKNITFSDGFPSSQVVEAYLEPKVETSKELFSWGKPDVISLKIFAQEKFGWTSKKTEQILDPVLKKLEENQSQKSIKDYFKTKFKVNPVDLEGKVSKRVKTAIDKIGKTPDELIAEEMAELEKEKERAIRKTKAGRTERPKSTRSKRKKDSTTEQSKSADADESSDLNDNDTNKDLKNIDKEATEPEKALKETDVRKDNQASKRPRKKKETDEVASASQPSNKSRKKKITEVGGEISKPLTEMVDLKDYENLAVELKTRRKRKNELIKINIEEPKKKTKTPPTTLEDIPEELEKDEEVKLLEATTSQSNKRVEEIKKEAFQILEKAEPKRKAAIPLSHLHTKDVIHQKLRDKSNSLRNKLKAIEVYRKSNKGPGFVPKRGRKIVAPKEDAGLSEDSDN